MKYICMLALFGMFACGQQGAAPDIPTGRKDSAAILRDKQAIESMLDSMNVAATEANFDRYFSFYAEDGVFLGTDATEYWDKAAFMAFAKPYFDKKQAWNFVSLKRNVYMDQSGKTAWFDELLDTQMKICRGSGVVSKEGGQWKIRQYVLSMTVPNSQVDPVVRLKAPEEDSLLRAMEAGTR